MQIDRKTEILRRIAQEQLAKTGKEKEPKNEITLEKNEDAKKNDAYDVSISKEALKEINEGIIEKREFEVERIKQSMSLVSNNIEDARNVASKGLSMKSLDLVV